VKLTPTEAKLLKVLLENRGRVLTHRELVLLVQGYEVTDWEAPEVLRPLVSRLRQKLNNFQEGESWIVNVRGTGYVLERRVWDRGPYDGVERRQTKATE
jgi:two-component system KDP operon response regulator KdpE